MIRIILTFIFVSSLVCIHADVPVFTWSNQLDLSFPQVFAGHSKSQQEFKHEYLHSDVSTLLMFVQNQISISDILINGGVYGSNQGNNYEQLKSMMENYISAYMPAVEKPVESILKMAVEKEYTFKKLSKAGMMEVARLQGELGGLDFEKKNLIVVDFTELIDADQKTIDSLIGSIVSHFKSSRQHFLAFYTAKHENQANVEMSSRLSESSRHLLATENNEVTGIPKEEEKPMSNGHFIISFDHILIKKGRVLNYSISMNDLTISNNTCLEVNSSSIPPAFNCSVSLNVGSADFFKDLILDLSVASSGNKNPGFWYVRAVVLSYLREDRRVVIRMVGGLTDPTPYGFSYSCYQAPPMLSMPFDNNTKIGTVTLQFEGLQIQAFAPDPPTYGHYNDCVGFFTIGIWMFLIVAVILISILLFGISMVMSINTMDRYDDPKGKTIIVSNVD